MNCSTVIEFVNHASALVTGGGVAVLSDRRYQGDASCKGWNLAVPTSDVSASYIPEWNTYIYRSHELPDHFSVRFFKAFAAIIKKRNIRILFQHTTDRRMVGFLQKIGLECIELTQGRRREIAPDVEALCFTDVCIDSGLMLQIGDKRILNLRDCEVTTEARARGVHGMSGDIHMLLNNGAEQALPGRPQALRMKADLIECGCRPGPGDRAGPFQYAAWNLATDAQSALRQGAAAEARAK